MKLSEIGEFGLIERIVGKIKNRSRKVLVGPGDDAAVFEIGNKLVLATSDVLVEGSHFDLRFTTAYSLGYKALAVSLSDIAAMGGDPKYGLVSLGFPSATSLSFADSLLKGIEAMASFFGISIIGGDTVSSQLVTINVTVLGEVEKERLTLRKGAKVGDKIYVTGPLGDAACGLFLLKALEGNGHPTSTRPTGRLVDRFLKPWPRVKEGKAISLFASSMIDISDGLALEIHHLAKSSKVGARLYLDKIPLSRALRRASKDPYPFALYGGEDYELLFTASPSKIGGLLPGYKIWEIGEVVKASEGIKIVDANGKEKGLLPLGYEHFKENDDILNHS